MLGLAQMERLDAFLMKKKTFNKIYKKELRNINSLSFQKEYEKGENSWWLSCIIFEKELDITRLQNKLKSKGIPTRRIFMPLTEFPPYQRYKKGTYKNSYHIYEKGLCLPCSTLNSKDAICYASGTIKKILRKK